MNPIVSYCEMLSLMIVYIGYRLIEQGSYQAQKEPTCTYAFHNYSSDTCHRYDRYVWTIHPSHSTLSTRSPQHLTPHDCSASLNFIFIITHFAHSQTDNANITRLNSIMKSLPRDRPTASLGNRRNSLQIQKELLHKALATAEGTYSWKILVFDSYNRGIVSSQMKMKDLREHNITLYLSISENRQQLHGVTILYLVQPTMENIQYIANDLISDLYTSVRIHFSAEPSPNIVSALAKRLTSSKKSSLVTRISKVEYSCLGYFNIDNSMAILPTQNQIVNLVTALSLTPIFIYNSKNEQSKILVDKVKNKLQSIQKAMEKENPVSQVSTYSTFYIFPRDTDYFPVLAHGITYASLLENLFKVNQFGNRVYSDSSTNSSELSLQDQIWLEKKNYLISQMELQKEFNRIQSKLMSLSNDQYSEWNEKSAKIKWHINNAEEMIKEAKTRRLNEFYDIELEMYSKGLLSKDGLRDALSLLKECSNQQDKLRFMLVYLHFVQNLDELPEMEASFPEVKKINKYNELKQKRLKGVVELSSSSKYIKKFAKGVWKSLLADDKKFRITKELEKIKNADFSEIVEAGLTVEGLDSLPKNIRIGKNIVYCLGGVCFHEYANIIENDPEAIYCGDKMISFRDFL